MRRTLAPFLVFLLPTAVLAASVDPPIPGIPGQKGPLPPTYPIAVKWQPGGALLVSAGGMSVLVSFDPFALAVIRASDKTTLLESATGPKNSGFAPAAFTRTDGYTWNTFYWGYRGYIGTDRPWAHSKSASIVSIQPDRVTLRVDADDPARGQMCFVVGPFYQGAVRLAVSAEGPDAPINRVALTFHSPAAEHFVGFGERFNAVNQRGRTLQCWSEEGSIEPAGLRSWFEPWSLEPEWALPGGTTTSYAPIPFFISSEGYGALADVPEPTHFDLAKTQLDKWRVQAESDQLSLVVFDGPLPADVLYRYTERTGRSLTPRPWMLAPWNEMASYRQGSPQEVARLFRQNDIPSTVYGGALHFLPAGSQIGHEDEIKAENAYYHALGYKAWAYFNPRVDKNMYAPVWQEGAANGYFYKAPDGTPYLLDVFGSQWFQVSEVDYTLPAANEWYKELLSDAIPLGYDGWMYDFGEYVPPDARFSDGHSGQYWHNPYALIYERSNFEYFRTLDDDPNDAYAPDYVFYHRSGYAGSQAYSWAMWGGDASQSWSVADGLPAAVTGGINCGLSGMPFWGCDIGGYHAVLVPPTSKELLCRWMEFGTFEGLMRDETAGLVLTGTRTQILDDTELLAIVRRCQKLRTQLVPYLENAAREAHETGLPIMRAPLLHYPGDPKAWDLKREFLCGRDLYVAPVVEEGAATRTLYLPPGDWVDLWARTEYDEATGGFRIGGEVVNGGTTLTVNAPLDRIPVFVRYGALIPLSDPHVDTYAPTGSPVGGVPVTSYQDLAHLLHAWSFPDPKAPLAQARLLDGSDLAITIDAFGAHISRTVASPDQKELWIQILWPPSLPLPTSVPGLTRVPGGDPLALAPGTWTWSASRHAVAVHGKPGQSKIDVLGVPFSL